MYDTKNTSSAHTQTAAQNQLIMVAKVAYDVPFITVLLTRMSVTPTFAYGRDQLNLQGVHTAHNRWHELLEHDRKHSNITCRVELDVGPRARERTVKHNATLDPKGLTALVGLGLLTADVARLPSDIPQLVGLQWKTVT